MITPIFPINLTRRQFLGTLSIVLFVPGKNQQYSLENDSLYFSVSVDKGVISSRTFRNKHANKTFNLPPEVFLMSFDDGTTITSSDMVLKAGARNKNLLELVFSGDSGVQARVRYSLFPGYLRKQISVKDISKRGRRLMMVNLENWQGVGENWNSVKIDPEPFGSHPVFNDNTWAGVEFVAAFNECNSEGFILKSRPGGLRIKNEWTSLHSTVTGTAKTGKVRESFLEYIEDIRLAPAKMTACYNSWWTLPKVVVQKDNLELIRELKSEMYDPHGVFFDIITTDMGWSNPKSIWEIDRSILPQGFDDIRSIVEPAGGKLGIWMSPSETYPPVCDYNWAEANGYTTLQSVDNAEGNRKAISLADPDYRIQAKEQLKKLIRENNLFHIKYDGFKAKEQVPHDDMLPGDDSVEPLAAYCLELLQASKEANNDLITEPTCMNSFANYISPWIIRYSDTVWANGTDCVVGIIPAPDYRESHTTAREYMIFKYLDKLWLPQNAVHYFDITHVDEHEGFPNHAAMAFGRGRFFVSTYLNPKIMNEADWSVYSGFLKWARANTDILRNTVAVPARVELGEPYTYAHWLNKRGILVVRNPSNETRKVTVDLERSGAPDDLSDAVCYTQYPYRKGIAEGLTSKSVINLDMAPWELLYIEITAASELSEPIAIGARWLKGSDNKMVVVPNNINDQVKILGPSGIKMNIPFQRKNEEIKGELISAKTTPSPEERWHLSKSHTIGLFPFKYPLELTEETVTNLDETLGKSIQWKKTETIDFEVRCSVNIPSDSYGKVLLLLEYPGRTYSKSLCECHVNGKQASIKKKTSEGHIGYYVPGGELRPYESEWCWYICDVGKGKHELTFKGSTGNPDTKYGLWLWSDKDIEQYAMPVDIICSDPSLPQVEDRIARYGYCMRTPAKI